VSNAVLNDDVSMLAMLGNITPVNGSARAAGKGRTRSVVVPIKRRDLGEGRFSFTQQMGTELKFHIWQYRHEILSLTAVTEK